MIRRSAVFDSVAFDEQGKPSGLADTYESVVRCVFDFDRGVFALYEYGKQERVDFTVPADFVPKVFWVQPPFVEEWRCLLVDFGNSRFWLSGSSHESRESRNIDTLPFSRNQEQILKGLKFLDPRVLGTYPHMCVYNSGDQGVLSAHLGWFRRRTSGEGFLNKTGPEDGMLTIQYSLPTGDDGLIHRDTVTFALDSSLPIRYFGQSRSKEGIPWGFRFEETNDWEQRGDHWLVKSVHRSQPTLKHGGDGVKIVDFTEYQTDLHWFSVNEELDPSFFDGSRIGGKDEVLKWLDPVKNKAVKLLPKQRDPSEGGPDK